MRLSRIAQGSSEKKGAWRLFKLCPNAITADRIPRSTNVPTNYMKAPHMRIVSASSMENRIT
jgi:hypothetical protein